MKSAYFGKRLRYVSSFALVAFALGACSVKPHVKKEEQQQQDPAASAAAAQRHANEGKWAKACESDAIKLCFFEIPNKLKITRCMIRKKPKLSPGCAPFFQKITLKDYPLPGEKNDDEPASKTQHGKAINNQSSQQARSKPAENSETKKAPVKTKPKRHYVQKAVAKPVDTKNQPTTPLKQEKAQTAELKKTTENAQTTLKAAEGKLHQAATKVESTAHQQVDKAQSASTKVQQTTSGPEVKGPSQQTAPVSPAKSEVKPAATGKVDNANPKKDASAPHS